MIPDAPRPFSAASFYTFLSENRLMGSSCTSCQRVYLPPRAVCPYCHGTSMEWHEFSGKGELAAFTSVNIGPSFMNAAGYSREHPYLTGIVRLQEGVMISARLLGMEPSPPEAIAIGTPLEAVYLEEGPDEQHHVVLAFKPEPVPA